MGQNTGTSNAEKNVAQNPKHSALVEEYLHVSSANMSIKLQAVDNASNICRETGMVYSLPEFELRKAPDKRLEFVIALRRQGGALQGGVHLRKAPTVNMVPHPDDADRPAANAA